MDTQELCDALMTPAFYGGNVRNVVARETHISWVFLAGEKAYKLKKPLKLPFLDYSTAKRRLRMCRAEVRLNRRTAPDVYLGVRAISAGERGSLELTDVEDARAVDYLVEMRRYDEDDTMAAKLARGELTSADVRLVAGALAAFHAKAPVLSSAPGARAVAGRVEENIRELLALLEHEGELRRLLALERFVHAFVSSRRAVLDGRAREGRVRDVHGDVRAEHVLLERDGQPRLLDCIEFDDALRRIDVADDLAFLLMDLTAREGERYTRPLIAQYRRSGGDPGEDRLLAFYACNHALVRSKVELIRAREQSQATSRTHSKAAARERLGVAERFAWRARLPPVLVMCGLPAAGKSHLAAALARTSGVELVSSDVTRKSLAGIAPGERAPVALYTKEWDERTYAALAEAAGRAAGDSAVIVDGTFRRHTERDTFMRLLDQQDVTFVECWAPEAVRLERALRRQREHERVSDATRDLIAGGGLTWEPIEEAAPQAHVLLRTDTDPQDQLEELAALLDTRMSSA